MKRLSWPALIALAALAPHPEARSQAGPSPVVIRGCSVLDVAGGRMIAGRTVVLDGGKIHAVAAPGDPVETPAGATTIAAVAALQKRPVRIVTEEEYVDRLEAAGKPEEYARRWATTYLAAARGEFGV